jgi:hypothetical protein
MCTHGDFNPDLPKFSDTDQVRLIDVAFYKGKNHQLFFDWEEG